jgi:hypothetical protein
VQAPLASILLLQQLEVLRVWADVQKVLQLLLMNSDLHDHHDKYVTA